MNPFFIGALGLGFLIAGRQAAAAGDVGETSPPGGQDPWTKYDASYKRYGAIWGVDWQWLKATALNESDNGQNPLVKNGDWSEDGLSLGLMQLTLTTALGLDPSATPQSLAQLEPNADFSINLAAKLFKQNMNEFPVVDTRWLEWVVKRYNGSAKAVNYQRLGTPNPDPNVDARLEQYWTRWQKNYDRVKNNS